MHLIYMWLLIYYLHFTRFTWWKKMVFNLFPGILYEYSVLIVMPWKNTWIKKTKGFVLENH